MASSVQTFRFHRVSVIHCCCCCCSEATTVPTQRFHVNRLSEWSWVLWQWHVEHRKSSNPICYPSNAPHARDAPRGHYQSATAKWKKKGRKNISFNLGDSWTNQSQLELFPLLKIQQKVRILSALFVLRLPKHLSFSLNEAKFRLHLRFQTANYFWYTYVVIIVIVFYYLHHHHHSNNFI